jgi:thioredoxin 1
MNSSFDNIIKSEKPVLIDFFATWCGLTKCLTYFKRGERHLGDAIIKIDVDKQQIASKYQVRGVPTMILSRRETIVRIRCLVDKNHH